MSNYIYDGKRIKRIKEIIDCSNRIGVISDIGSITYYPRWEFEKIFSECKIFDNLEDLIEVGDLLLIEDSYTNIKNKTTFELVTNIKECDIETRNYYNVKDMIIEIWKRVANTFVRVAHKIDNEWVID